MSGAPGTVVKAWRSLLIAGLMRGVQCCQFALHSSLRLCHVSCQHYHQKRALLLTRSLRAVDHLQTVWSAFKLWNSTVAVASLWLWWVLSLRLVLAYVCCSAFYCCFAVAADLLARTLFVVYENLTEREFFCLKMFRI